MGVRGLTTYINCNDKVFMQTYYLHDTMLVIDGHSLCAQLYRSMKSFSAFGGDYDKFASHIKIFFKNLRKCNVTPYIIFDGCHERRKLKTVFSRLRSKLKGTARLDAVTQDSLIIFPLLHRDVFTQVLDNLQLAYTVCEFEADDEIASLARYLNCPVLSYDSDFFIYNVMYIPFNTLELKAKPIEENDNKYYAMECKLFRVEYLCQHFGNLNVELLPLLATLLGNDYVKKRVFNKFFSQLALQKSKKKKNIQQRNIHALFAWLQNETLDSAIAKVLGRLKKHQKDKVFFIIKKSVSGYNNNHCKSLKFFNISNECIIEKLDELQMPVTDKDESTSESDNEESSDTGESEGSSNVGSAQEFMEPVDKICESNPDKSFLPEWFIDKIRKNLIPKLFLNLYPHHLHICNPQPEDFAEQDSFFCVLPILRYVFDMLTDFSHESCVYVGREQHSNYKRFVIDMEYSIPRALEIPFCELTDDQLRKCFYHFMDMKLSHLDLFEIQLLPKNFQLFMIALLWWICYCNVPAAHVHSLIISYITLEVIDERTGSSRGAYHFNNKHAKKLEELKIKPTDININEELFLNKNKVHYEDCLIAASVLLKHFEIAESVRKRPKSYDIKKIHSMAQFQCALYSLNSLNTLCGSPFECTTYSKCYNGTFIYNIALKLENQKDPMNCMEQYLKGATTVILLYKSIFFVLNKLMEKMNISTVPWSAKKKHSRKRKGREDDKDISFIVKGFEAEMANEYEAFNFLEEDYSSKRLKLTAKHATTLDTKIINIATCN